MPISKKEFDDAKLESDGNDKLSIDLFTFLNAHSENAYTTAELCAEFKCDNTDTVLVRLQRLQKQKKLEGSKPKHSRMYYWTVKR